MSSRVVAPPVLPGDEDEEQEEATADGALPPGMPPPPPPPSSSVSRARAMLDEEREREVAELETALRAAHTQRDAAERALSRGLTQRDEQLRGLEAELEQQRAETAACREQIAALEASNAKLTAQIAQLQAQPPSLHASTTPRAHIVGEERSIGGTSHRAKKAATSRGPLSCFLAMRPSKRVPSSTVSSPDDDNWRPDQHDPNTPRGAAAGRPMKAGLTKANLL